MSQIKIGELITKIIFVESEKQRILASLKDETSLITTTFKYSILTPQVAEAKFCATIARKAKMTGDRDGGAPQREKILKKCLAFAEGQTALSDELFWMVYRNLVCMFVENRLPKLDDLLKKSFCNPLENSPEQIINNIVKFAPDFKVKNHEIKQLYEIWGFERIQNFDHLFNRPNHDHESLQEAKEEIIQITDDLSSKVADLSKESEKRRREFETETEALKDGLKKLRSENARISDSFDLRINNFSTSIENLRAQVKTLPEQKAIREIKRELETVNDQLKSLQISIRKIEEMQVKQTKELSRVNEKIGRKIVISSSDIGVKKIAAGKSMISELEFVQLWKSRLKNTLFSNLGLDELLPIHLFFKNFRCFLLRDPDLFDSWCSALGWDSFVASCVAEPTWTRSEQCLPLASFSGSQENPSILKILNFNCALPEGYLFPNVLPWLNKEEFTDRKLVLLPNGEEDDLLRESASYFPFLMTSRGRLEVAPVFKDTIPTFYRESDPIFVSTLSIWKQELEPNYEDNRDILNLIESHDIDLPVPFLKGYTVFRSALEQFFDPNSAILTSYQMIILPWLKLCRNEISAEQITQNVRTTYE